MPDINKAKENALEVAKARIKGFLATNPMPFGFEAVDTKKQMELYEQLTPEQLDQMRQDKGEMAVARYLLEMERRRARSD